MEIELKTNESNFFVEETTGFPRIWFVHRLLPPFVGDRGRTNSREEATETGERLKHKVWAETTVSVFFRKFL